jgi:tail assembly chaperone E/41/14-like protein
MPDETVTDKTGIEPPKPTSRKDGDPVVVPLSKKVIANGDEVDSLTFREPTAADIERIGNPVNIDFIGRDTPKITFDSKIMTQMMGVLAAVPPSTIRMMKTRDWNTAAWSLCPFFIPEDLF